MTVAELIEKLRQFPQDLEVHIMADLRRDLVDIASIHLITKPFTEEPFVVIDVDHQPEANDDPGGEVQNPQDNEHNELEGPDPSSTPKQ